MSAFICGTKTFNAIYSGLKVYGQSDTNEMHFAINRVLGGKPVEDFIDIMYRLNVRAVNQRYNDNTQEDGGTVLVKELCRIDTDITRGRFLKALECLSYQMSEGDVPETREYKLVDKLIHAVTRDMAHSMEEYESAEWDG